MGERDVLSGSMMWEIKTFMEKWTFQNFFEKHVGSTVGDPEHRGSIHLAQLAMVGEKITLWVKSDAFWMSLGVGHVAAHMGLFFYSPPRSARKLSRSKFWKQFFGGDKYFSEKFLWRGRRKGRVWSIVLPQLKHARNRCNISFTWFCSTFSLGTLLSLTPKYMTIYITLRARSARNFLQIFDFNLQR